MKKALIIGINAYPGAPLTGQVNDANDFNDLLLSRGFSNTVLLDSGATKAAILSGLLWLTAGAQSGDSLAFAFFGHGSQVADISGDEADGIDEAIVPVNYSSAGFIIDDDLRAIFSGLPAGCNLDVFLGCCYSGTGTRDADKRPLFIPSKIKPKGKVRGFKTLNIVNLNHCLWSACKDSQTAWEGTINGIPRGIWAYYCAKYIRSYPNNTRKSLDTAITTAVKKAIPSQEPQLECSSAESLQRPFT